MLDASPQAGWKRTSLKEGLFEQVVKRGIIDPGSGGPVLNSLGSGPDQVVKQGVVYPRIDQPGKKLICLGLAVFKAVIMKKHG